MTATKIRVIELEDHGQDFLRLYIDPTGKIVDVKPFQAWLWTHYRVVQKTIRRGMRLRLQRCDKEIILRYPVVSVKTQSQHARFHADREGAPHA